MKNNKQIAKITADFLCKRYDLESTESVLVVDGTVQISLKNGDLLLDWYDYPQSIFDFIGDFGDDYPELLVDIKNPGCLTVSNV